MPAPFVNWARTVRSRPRGWARPLAEAEVVRLVRDVRARRGRLRVSGARHSWSAIAASDDVQVELRAMTRVLRVDREARTITVQGGCTLAAINAALARRGLALPILGSIAEQSVSGAIATGTHGSSLRHGNLSSLVRHVRLVDGRGQVLDLAGDDPRLPAARVHLGALGVITEVTLTADPAYALEETCTRLPLDAAADQLDALAAAHEYVKLWWLPPCEEVAVFALRRVPLGPRRPWARYAWDVTASSTVFPALLAYAALAPSRIPAINRLVDRLHFRAGVRAGRSDEVFLVPAPPRHRETELAFPAARAGEALRALRDLIVATGARLDFLSELRFVRGDDAWMSPAHGRDTCQLGVYGTHSPDVPRAFAAFRELGRAWDARPHWGKEMQTTPTELRRLYPRADDFIALARELDPDGVFRNAFLDAALA